MSRLHFATSAIHRNSIDMAVTAEDHFNATYLNLKARLGILELGADQYPDPITGLVSMEVARGNEALTDTLASFAGIALKYLGNGLFALGERTFEMIRNQTEKRFLSYPSMVTNWKSRVWSNARSIDGKEFDAYKVDVVPHAELIKRIQAVEAVHKALDNVSAIVNAPVAKNSDDWTTPECDKAIQAMEKIGFKAKNYDFLNTVSKTYAGARKKQPLYLHGYTPKRILDVLTRCEKLASYGDPKYIEKFEETYLSQTDKLEDYEADTDLKSAEVTDKGDVKNKKEIEMREHESKIRAARLWWLAHFLKAAYTVTSDILRDAETLATATSRTLSKTTED